MSDQQPSGYVLTAADFEALVAAMDRAESLILSTIDRQCEALRTRRFLAADALQTRLTDAARFYLNLAKAARASMGDAIEQQPDVVASLEDRRRYFGSLLKIELAALAAERVAAQARPADRIDPAPAALDSASAVESPRRSASARLRSHALTQRRGARQGLLRAIRRS